MGRSRKRLLLALAEPILSLLWLAYRLLSGRWRGRWPLEPQRILVVRLDSIGDVLLSEPAIAALRRRYPSARVDVAVSAAGREVLAGSPNVDRFVLYESPWHAAWRGKVVHWLPELSNLWHTTNQLRAERYDLGVELRGDVRDLVFTALAGPRFIVGSPIRGGRALLDRVGPTDESEHRVEFNLGIVAAAGAAAPTTRPRLQLTGAARDRAREWLGDNDVDYIGVHLGAGFVSKQVPVPTYVEALGRLVAADPRRRPVLIGGPDEAPLAQQFASLMEQPYLDLVGHATVIETAAVLERCRLFIGNDSAPMHLAASVGTPVVAAFGPSAPSNYAPYGVPHRIVSQYLPCSPCDYVHCIFPVDPYRCVNTISPQALVEAAESLLGESPWRSTAASIATNDPR